MTDEGMVQGTDPLDLEAINETVSALENVKVDDIPYGPNIVAGIMSDAALIIRALADKAGVNIDG